MDWSKFIDPKLSDLLHFKNDSLHYSNGRLSLTYIYTQTIQDEEIELNIDPQSLANNSIFSQIAAFTAKIKVQPNNNVYAVFCDKKICHGREQVKDLVYASEGISYFALMMSIFSSKIIGL